MCFYIAFNSLGHEIETRNREEIPFSLQMVLRGLSVAEGSKTALHKAAH